VGEGGDAAEARQEPAEEGDAPQCRAVGHVHSRVVPRLEAP
jgi:hypothetical protein